MQPLVTSKLRTLKDKITFTSGLVGSFFISQLIFTHFHEMWRDELQAWSIARTASNYFDLFQNLRYEGHPALWHTLLFIISRFTGNPFAMQVLHILIASASIYLVAKYAPFGRLQKVLLSFGYLLFYEYGVIARNYNLGVFFVLLFCVLITRPRKNYLAIGTVLFLMAQTNAMTALLVPVLGAYALWDAIEHRGTKHGKLDYRRLSGGMVIAIIGLALAYKQTLIPKDTGVSLLVGPDIRNALGTVWQSYAPIPARVLAFWNTNILGSFDQVILLSIGLVVSCAVFFSRNLKLLVIYLLGTLAFVMFFDQKLLGGVRQQGFLFILFVVCAWLLMASQKKKQDRSFHLYQLVVLYVLFGLQFLAGGVAAYKDVRVVFSQSHAVAQYIDSQNLAKLPIVGQQDFTVAPVASYLDRDVYFAQSHTQGSFVIWNQQRNETSTDAESINYAHQIAQERRSDVLLVTPLPLQIPRTDGIIKIRSFVEPSVVDGNYYLYRVERQ